ncbi:hypothetical protein AB0I49_15345 [Streptomyces sp. NPDC050617]|uniref:hypothetical protein n=1 Tax=Streptomyces sp. NPDC050617 TaxID=3154628 RepID=UPI00341E116E
MSRTSPAPRGRLLRLAAACAVLLALIGYLIAHFMTAGPGAPRCTAASGGKDFSLDPEQAANAATIEAVGSARRLPERAVTIALATAMQESGLRNIKHGDRDSVGLFQQRPSQGWGTARQITDPVYSAGKFYDDLVDVDGYERLPLTVAAQAVQHSAFPEAYEKHAADATLLAAALTGRPAASFTCTTSPSDGRPGSATAVRAKLRTDFGTGLRPVLGAGSGRAAHTVTVPVKGGGASGESQRRGLELARWAVAHAEELRIASVSFGGREWTSAHSGDGWRKSADASVTDVRIATAQ